jgi:hypothetical protein
MTTPPVEKTALQILNFLLNPDPEFKQNLKKKNCKPTIVFMIVPNSAR